MHLRDANLVLRNKYPYLYDFGDEWMLYVTVIGIRECNQEMPITIPQSQGELCQYPKWDDDDSNEEVEKKKLAFLAFNCIRISEL